jgi:hypothetical protein
MAHKWRSPHTLTQHVSQNRTSRAKWGGAPLIALQRRRGFIFVALKRRRVFRTTVKGRRGSSLYKTRKEEVHI